VVADGVKVAGPQLTVLREGWPIRYAESAPTPVVPVSHRWRFCIATLGDPAQDSTSWYGADVQATRDRGNPAGAHEREDRSMPRRIGRGGIGPGPGRPVMAAAATGAVVGAAAAGGRRGAGAGGHRYQMRQRMFAIGDDFFIEDDQGRRAFKVDGKALRVRSTLKFEDANGRELYKIQEKLARVRDSMTIERADGGAAAKVHNALITPLRDRWTINIPGGDDMSTQGNIVQHEYRIEQGRTTIATVSKKWFRVRDSYGVDIAPGQDDALILAITVVIDMMAHQGR